jgi:hypothetical protein
MKVQEIVLEKVLLGCEAEFSDQMIDAKVEVCRDWFSNRVRAQVRGFLWGKTIESHHVQYPEDWWQAVKERWAPAWCKQRWPVRYKTIDLDLKAVWPTLRLLVPKHEPRLVLTSFGQGLGGYSNLDTDPCE